MVQVAPVLLEAVRRRQGVRVVTQVVLAELAGVVAEVTQEHCDRRGARFQIGRAAGELRWDHAGAQRIHAGEERVASRRAALHGDIVHEPSTLFREAVDVGCFPDAHAIGVGLHLHPADVVGHDEEDVGFLSLLGGGRNACHRCGCAQHDKSAPDCSEYAHGCFPQLRLLEPGRSLRPIPRTDPLRCSLFADRYTDHAVRNRSDASRAGSWSKRFGYAMRIRRITEMFVGRVAAWLKVTRRRRCGTSLQSAQTPGIGSFERSLRRSQLKLFNRCSNRYRVGLTPRNSAQHIRRVRSGTPISAQSVGTLTF